jgi:Tol biopolymer transport system component
MSGIALLTATLLSATPQRGAPHLHTTTDAYLAGQPVEIVGSGFSPFDLVALQVTHDDGTAEPGAGHERFFVEADSTGSFRAAWSIDVYESTGVSFVVSAEGRSGGADQAFFVRTGTILAGPDDTESDLRMRAEGFNPGEAVRVTLSDASVYTAISDEDGLVSLELDFPDGSLNAPLDVFARGERSQLTLKATVRPYSIRTRRPNGVPLLQEVQSARTVSEIGHRQSNSSEDFYMKWTGSASTMPGWSANACALFDTGLDEDSAIDIAVCGTVVRASESNGALKNAGSLSVLTCTDQQLDRCGQPTPYASPEQLRTGVKSTALDTLTLRIVIDKSLLPPGAKLERVCSYSENTPDSQPLGCIDVDGTALPVSSNGAVVASSLAPLLTGRIVYHSYVSYNDGTSQLFILNLASGTLTNLSSKWNNLKDPMNAHWSPDGTKIVFMARPKKGGNYSAWFDIFLYTIGQSGNPANLTSTATRHDEDPKFSPDGSRIVYKVRPSTLLEMDLSGRVRNTIISTSGPERSMPYYTPDASAVWYSHLPSGGTGSAASIHRINLNGSNDSVSVDTPGVIDFYPIADTVGQFLYARTVSALNLFGQIYLFNGTQSISLPFNTPDADYSDAYPVGAQYIVLSSTRAGGRGGYDLYLADRNTGVMWPISSYNPGVNTSREELGASYTSN